MTGLSINIRTVSNGWLVEIWRGRNPKEEHVFTETDAMMQFVDQIARHG